jgi:hypothetical protein
MNLLVIKYIIDVIHIAVLRINIIYSSSFVSKKRNMHENY